ACFERRFVPVDHYSRHPVAIVVLWDAAGHVDEVANGAIGDPLLAALDDVMVAVRRGRGLDSTRIRAAVGFRTARGTDKTSSHQTGHEALSLFRTAPEVDARGRCLVGLNDEPDSGRQLFPDQPVVQHAESRSTCILGD